MKEQVERLKQLRVLLVREHAVRATAKLEREITMIDEALYKAYQSFPHLVE